MTGRFVYQLEEKDRAHILAKIYLNHAEPIFYCDTRKFSTIEVISDELKYFEKLGLEPLSEEFDDKYLMNKLNSARAIKAILLDQSIVSGIGNIYADEVLFDAKILPSREAKSISLNETKLIVSVIKKILSLAIENMGTTLSDYRTPKQEKGQFQGFLKIYGRKKQKCVICENWIEIQTIAGRTSHFCSHCQK